MHTDRRSYDLVFYWRHREYRYFFQLLGVFLLGFSLIFNYDYEYYVRHKIVNHWKDSSVRQYIWLDTFVCRIWQLIPHTHQVQVDDDLCICQRCYKHWSVSDYLAYNRDQKIDDLLK